MKVLVTSIVLLISLFSFSQNRENGKTTETNNLEITLTINEEKDLDKFNIDKLNSFFVKMEANKDLKVKLILPIKELESKDKIDISTKVSMVVNGNSNDINSFVGDLREMKTQAETYLKTK